VAIKIDDASIDDVKISKSDSYNDSRGDIIIKGLTVTYRHDMEPVLNDLDLIIPAGSKVGICGRTGSGKSSTLLALLRLNIIVSGDILVDGKSLLKMSLEDARGLISVIPQDPHLFSGTILSS
jgi:ABC-type multidrug transport system fused ATPase/permease subunit